MAQPQDPSAFPSSGFVPSEEGFNPVPPGDEPTEAGTERRESTTQSVDNSVMHWDDNLDQTSQSANESMTEPVMLTGTQPLIGRPGAPPKDVYDGLSQNQKKWIHIMFMVTNYCYGALWGSILVVYPDVAQDQGHNDTIIQWVLAGNGIGGLIASFVFNILIKLLPRRMMYAGSTIMIGVSTALFAIGPFISFNSEVIYLLLLSGFLLLMGLFRIFHYNIMLATTSKMYMKQVTSKISILLLFLSIGVLTGPIVISTIAELTDFSFAILLLGIAHVAVGIWAFFVMPESYAPKKKAMSVFQILFGVRNMLTNMNMGWVNFINRISVTGTTLYYVNVLGVKEGLVPYLNDINASAIMIMSLSNAFLEKYFDHRFIHIVFGLFATGLGAFLVGPVIPFLPEHFLPLSVCGFFCLQLAMPAISPTSNTDLLVVMREQTGHEVDIGTRDAASSLVNFWQISTWFIGPFFYGAIVKFIKFENLLGLLGIVNFVLGVSYIFGSNLWKEGIWNKHSKR